METGKTFPAFQTHVQPIIYICSKRHMQVYLISGPNKKLENILHKKMLAWPHPWAKTSPRFKWLVILRCPIDPVNLYTTGNTWLCCWQCSCWWPGAKVPGHLCQQRGLNISNYWISFIQKYCILNETISENWNYILKCLRTKSTLSNGSALHKWILKFNHMPVHVLASHQGLFSVSCSE